MRNHPLAFTVALFIAFCLLAGCVTTADGGREPTADGGRELTATGKVALQEVTAIAVRRSLATSPRAQEKAANIRAVAARLAAVTDATTVSDLKVAVEAEVDALGLNEVDRADAQSLLNIFAALLTDYIGKDDLDADALVRVNEFIALVLAALPPPTAPV